MTLSAGARLGPYEVIGPIGAGGMGEVYRARDTRLGREVALKTLPEALASDSERLSRFEQEARAASALNHPNIVTIHDIGREGSTEFIAMELVDGKTLRELAASGPLPIRRILGVAAQIAEGLAKAHAAGIVHRDLKPENVMVTRDGFVKILDFGLAKLMEPEAGGASAMPTLAHPETRPGTVMGTVGYMSPEQASGEGVDFRSDQFSLGSILYEVSTGQKAFQRKTAAETMSAIIREEPEPVTKLRPDLPSPVRWILERCLAKDPEDRYASTRDLARDLSGVRDHMSEISSGAEAAMGGRSRLPARARSVGLGLALCAAGLLAGWALARGAAERSASPRAPSFKRLTFRQGTLGNARFARDGQTVVYGASFDVDETRGRNLYQTRPESPESRRFDFPGDILAISGKGELAILVGQRIGLPGTLARVPITGGVPHQVLEGVPYAGADFSPDDQLAAVHIVDGKTRLEFPIGNVLVPDGVGSPRFSLGGDLIAFYVFDRESYSVTIIDRLGKNRKALSSGWSDAAGSPSWTPDGREVWFTASQPGQNTAIWAVDRTGRTRLVMRTPGSLELEDISRTGSVLLAHHTQMRTLRGFAPGESKERELSWLDGSRIADLSSDGKTLVLDEVGEGAGPEPVIYVRGTDGSPAVRLGEGEGIALSPDGKWVLASVASRRRPDQPGPAEPSPRRGAASLVLLPTGPGQPKTLEADRFDAYPWGAWLPDGRRVVYAASSDNERVRLYLMELPDGKPRAISPEGVALQNSSCPVSLDGQWIVGRRSGQVVLCPIGGGEPKVIPGLTEADRPIQWSSDGRSVYVYRRDLPLRVFLVDVKSGERRLFREFPLEGIGGALRIRITPDGRSYAYSGWRVQSELYLVDDLR